MKKTKLYLKKSLSVLMAVLMVLTAWVFVPGEHNHASAASATTVAGTNTTALSSIGSFNTDVTFFYDHNWAYNGDYQENEVNIYKNVLYASDCGSSATASTGSVNLKDSGAATIEWYHGTYIFLYDGVTTPTAGVMVAVKPKNSSHNVRMYSSYISSGEGLDLAHNWYASDGRANFMWVISAPGNENAATKDGSINSSYCWTVNSNTWYANKLQFTGSMSDTEYYKDITVTWGWKGNQKSQGTGNVYTYTAKAVNHVYVVNYKPLKAALNEALGTGTYSISTLKNNAAKYTTASIAEYVAAVKDLIAAKPNNYLNSSNNNYTGYANAASAAVTRFNNAKTNLEVQEYTLTFKSQNGTTKAYSYDYGTAITPSSLAPANSVTQGDDDGHQTYVWDVTNMSLTSLVDDVTINEVADKKVAHNFDKNGNGSVDAGDYTQGDTTHSLTCTVCGYVKTQDHVKDSGTVTGQDTCTEAGTKTYNCAICGKTAIDSDPVDEIKGHDFSGEYVIETDGKDGTHHIKCIRFDECGTYGTSIPHDWDANKDGKVDIDDATVTTAPGCLSTGVRTYHCQTEGCTATYTETIDATGHKNVKKTFEKNVAEICGGHGYSAFWTCPVCGKIYKNEALTDEISEYKYTEVEGVQVPTELVVNGPDHSFTGAYVSVSGGENGKHKRQCVRFTQCNTYGSEEAHNYTSTTVESTCISQGRTTYTCSDCKQTYYKELPLAAHNMTKNDRVEPACNVPGSIEYYSCSVCNKNYDDANGTNVVTNTIIAALTHTWTEHHDYDTLNIAATCMAAAKYNKHCDYCQTKISGTYPYGDPDTVNGHKFNGEIKNNDDGTHSYKCTVEGCTEYGANTSCDFTTVKEDVASTCCTIGYTVYECAGCKATDRVEKTAYDFDNHSGGTEIKFALEAKCNTDGYTGDTYCLGCKGKIASGTVITADKTVHPHEDMKDYEAKEATCQTAGWEAYRYCANCGTYEIEKVEVAKKAHKFTAYTSNDDGTHTATCATCDAAVATPVTDTKDCSGGTANCVDKKVCTVCNTAYGEVDANNHKTVTTIATVPATCQKEGREAYRYCKACDTALEVIKKIDKLEHAYGAWSKVEGEDKHTRSCTTCDADVADVATQTEACSGGIAYCNALAKCATCKAEYGVLAPENHKTQSWHVDEATVKAATCQAEGFTGNRLYDCCNALKEAGKATDKLAHTFVEETRTAATCIATGSVAYKCSTCVESEGVEAATKTEVLPIDAKNHASEETVKVKEKAATCESDGYTGDVYHECCYVEGADDTTNRKALVSKGSVIKANGQHVFGTAVPEYMIDDIEVTKDADGNVTAKEFVLKTTAPDYAGKIAARHEDGKWYHAQLCTECYEVKYTACYTYEHTYNCVDADICEVCAGLCSLIDADKHKADLVEVTDDAVAATCVSDGVKSHYKCADCGKTYFDEAGKKPFDPENEKHVKALVISKATVNHTLPAEPDEKVEASCGSAGSEIYYCTVEGCDYFKTVTVDAASGAHVWKTEYDIIKEATCGVNGRKAIKCELCGATKSNSTVIIPATGEHNYVLNDELTEEGTSCNDPTILHYECSVCGATKTEEDHDGVSAHTWGDWVTVSGDCTTGILQERTCSVCNATEQKRITTDAHEFELYLEVLPDAQQEGYRIYKCVNCGFEKTEVPPYDDDNNEGGEGGGNEGGETPDTPDTPDGDGHIVEENAYKVVKKADCRSGEIRRYTCILCGESVEREISEPTDHVLLTQPAEVATCTRAGHSEYKRCVICYEEFGRVNYEPLGHKDNDGNGKCDNCSGLLYSDGEKVEECGCICHNDSFLMKLIYKIVNFFWKLFKIRGGCECGMAHY